MFDKPEYEEAIRKHTDAIIAQHMLEVEGLTKEQLSEAFVQALKAGDFVRYVHARPGGHAQAVTYIPYERAGMQESRIRELEEKVEKLRDKLNEMRNVLGDCD